MSNKPERPVLHQMAEKLHKETNQGFIECFQLLKHADYDMAKAIQLHKDNFLNKTRLIWQ
jgi:translation elongation factor EF-Ts